MSEEKVHKPKHWFLKFWNKGVEKELDNSDTMGIATAVTANYIKGVMRERGWGEYKIQDFWDHPEFLEMVTKAVCFFSAYCYMQRVGKKDNPEVEIGKAKNYIHYALHGKWEGE